MQWYKPGKFHFNWKLTLTVVLLLPLLLRLGFWQLAREAEKQHLQDLYEARLQAIPRTLTQLDLQDDLLYLPVLLQGEYDNAHSFLLDNRTHNGQAGFEVLTPFLLDEGSVVFVNRGWIAGSGDRRQLPQVPEVSGNHSLSGIVYIPPGEQMILGDSQAEAGWPKVVQEAEVAELARLAQADPVFPHVIRLDPGAPGVLQRNWSVVSTSPEKHRAYAVQWFAMALALVLLYWHASTRERKAP